jgi:2-oxoglutarate ferredoxin oxidoreductase subunit delta
MRKSSWIIYPKFCKGCGLCLVKCPTKALSFGQNKGVYGNPVPQVDRKKCLFCGWCEEICPDSALTVKKQSA